MNTKLNIFAFFHLNLMFSSIEKNNQISVIKKCYWPLINLIKNKNIPIGIELSANTLEIIHKLDPNWVNEFKKLIKQKKCDLIGSGYSQVIGPLVPAKLFNYNLKIGNKIYKKILNVLPKIALVNEQVFSSSLISSYKKNKYNTIIMDWNNPYSINPKWDQNIQFKSNYAIDNYGNEINVIWNNSISFQKFQKYAHGEISLDDIIKFIESHNINKHAAFPLYGNDAEVFNFRPGRFKTEALIINDEWKKIENLLDTLLVDHKFIKVSEVEKIKTSENKKRLEFTNIEHPIAVKKQGKYNVLRWAVTGRDDLAINTKCYKIFKIFEHNKIHSEKYWKKLCYLWSSDFRTHITDKKWKEYLATLNNFLGLLEKNFKIQESNVQKNSSLKIKNKKKFSIEIKNQYLKVIGKKIVAIFNCNKGLAIDTYINKDISNKKIFGTLEHGYFNEINYGVDFFTGHLVLEPPGKHKITDLIKIKPKIIQNNEEISILTTIKTQVGYIKKKWVINDKNGKINLHLHLNWKKKIVGSLRLAHLTLCPEAFKIKNLKCQTHNGGDKIETFKFSNKNSFSHSAPVSNLVSANQALGLTKGIIKIGDNKKMVSLKFDKSQAALVGMINHKLLGKKNLTRIILSAMEIDDTLKKQNIGDLKLNLEISIKKV